MSKVFLGGTCNNSTWREDLIPLLKIDYFNPVVPAWKPEHLKEELKQRTECDFVLYVLTSEMTGFYSIAEVVDDCNKRPEKTVFCYLPSGFTDHQLKSLKAIAALVTENGAMICEDLNEVAYVLNTKNSLMKEGQNQ